MWGFFRLPYFVFLAIFYAHIGRKINANILKTNNLLSISNNFYELIIKNLIRFKMEYNTTFFVLTADHNLWFEVR